MVYAKVIIDISADALDHAFTYRVPEALEKKVCPGIGVIVPFGSGNRKRKAYVTELTSFVDYEEDKIKEILAVDSSAQKAAGDLIGLARFMAEEYGSTMNQALLTVLPVKRKIRKNSRRSDPVERMEEKQAFQIRDEELTPKQKNAAEELLSERTCPSLLYGITGSGKTRVYIELIRRIQTEGKKCIVLIPEISLTYQTVNELMAHLGQKVAVLHSKLSDGERYEQICKCAAGELDVIVGPRSAIFTPFENLGLVIIDEEHEHAYQSDTAPRYDVRTVAEYRCRMAGAKLVLGSATPSLESYKKALEGTWNLSVLSERAVPGAVLPEILLADMRSELKEGNKSMFSSVLAEKITECLEKKEQIMLFLNRRGYAGFVSCRSCGTVIKCPHCDVSMTAHNSWYTDPVTGNRKAALLSCHYCGYRMSMPTVCSSCGSRMIAPFGTGTQKLEQEVKRNFPGARVLRMDADTTSAKDGHEQILRAFRKGEADILIGTQMIVKGHDFPRVTLVGIMAADQSINLPEYDAAERTYQLLTQAAGRAGRGNARGCVVIQSYEPEHYAIQMAAHGTYPEFYEREDSFRRLMSYPPEVGLLGIKLMSGQEDLVNEAAVRAAGMLTEEGKYVGAQVIGPCNASIYRVKDIYRKLIYIKHPQRKILLELRQSFSSFIRKNYTGKKLWLSFDIR